MPSGPEWAPVLRRIAKDMERLRRGGYVILREDGDSTREPEPLTWCTLLYGPADTPYAGGAWRVRFEFGKDYPFKSPSVGFVDRILHPNVDWVSGSVCLDALAKEWTSTTFVVAIMDSLLPALLNHPNPHDPLNPDAAHAMQRNPAKYDKDVRAAAKKHAHLYNDPPLPSTGASAGAGTGSDSMAASAHSGKRMESGAGAGAGAGAGSGSGAGGGSGGGGGR